MINPRFNPWRSTTVHLSWGVSFLSASIALRRFPLKESVDSFITRQPLFVPDDQGIYVLIQQSVQGEICFCHDSRTLFTGLALGFLFQSTLFWRQGAFFLQAVDRIEHIADDPPLLGAKLFPRDGLSDGFNGRFTIQSLWDLGIPGLIRDPCRPSGDLIVLVAQQ